MTATGSFKAWAACFPDDCLPLVFNTLVEEWPNFRRADRPLENRITHNFVAYLQRVTRWKVPFGFYYRDKKTSSRKDSEEGEIDIVVRAGIDPLVFFGFECKRLNVVRSDGRTRSEAAAYVGDEGMGCFLSGQYEGGGESGGMIGYVLDGNIHSARLAVEHAIQTNAISLQLLPPEALIHVTAFLIARILRKPCIAIARANLRFTMCFSLFTRKRRGTERTENTQMFADLAQPQPGIC